MTSSGHNPEAQAVLLAVRRIVQAVDIHSRRLMQGTGLSVPQLLVLQALAAEPGDLPGTKALAARLNLTQGTISSILERLERKSLLRRDRGGQDKRRVQIRLTDEGRQMLSAVPGPLQQHFVEQFGALPDWERSQLLSSLQRVAALMHADAMLLPPMEDPLLNPD